MQYGNATGYLPLSAISIIIISLIWRVQVLEPVQYVLCSSTGTELSTVSSGGAVLDTRELPGKYRY
jgi:hypothetical protein